MKNLPILLFFFIAFQLSGQVELPIPLNLKKAYDRSTRSTDGQPGKSYWQNHADYTIAVKFDPATRLIDGAEDIVYTNNSPDTLQEIVFKLYPNLYKSGTPRMMSIQPEDVTSGVNIKKISVNDEAKPVDQLRIAGTNMTVRIKSLMPGQQLRFHIEFAYTLNKASHIRTGEIEDGAYFVAYFFPRIAVYDDIDGWNRLPYIGSQEFYNDFCHFQASITVPNGYAVWATGDLKNAREVYPAKIVDRIAKAEKEDGFINIIDSTDLKAGQITANHPTNAFVFEADNVTDFVFATSNHYMWQSTSLVVDKTTNRRTRVDAVFNPKHIDYFRVISDARKTVELMSFEFPRWPFPYAHETVFDGLDQMEYPMMVNDNPVEDVAESVELTDHEIFHTMFPFYMGINETKYGWMDEGWATIGEWILSPLIEPGIVDEYGVAPYEHSAGTEQDAPIMTLTTMLTGAGSFTNSYPKPAMGYLFAKDLLGDDLFYKGLHHYIRTWNGKHPIPYDFFNCMNTGSGKNLNWFWKAWFFDNGFPDLSIANAVTEGNKTQITIQSIGTKPVPVDLTVTFTDNSQQKLHYSVEVWEKGSKTLNISLEAPQKIKDIKLGSTYVPDINKKDNVWPR